MADVGRAAHPLPLAAAGVAVGMLFGARFGGVVPEWWLRPILALTLCYAACTRFNKG